MDRITFSNNVIPLATRPESLTSMELGTRAIDEMTIVQKTVVYAKESKDFVYMVLMLWLLLISLQISIAGI